MVHNLGDWHVSSEPLNSVGFFAHCAKNAGHFH